MNKKLKSSSIIFSLALLIFACTNNPEEKNEVQLSEQQENKETLFSLIPTQHSNLTFRNDVVQTRENNHMINPEFISGAGVAVGDINNDGLQDVFFTGNQVQDRLYLNKGDFQFEDISDSANISTDNQWSSGVTFVDIDMDGDQDIYVCRNIYLENDKSANQLYINNGDLTFTEKANEYGLDDMGFSMQAIFFDFDNDQLLDVYVVNQPPNIRGITSDLGYAQFPDIRFSDRLYRNTGNGKFIDHTEKGNVRNLGFTLSASVGDFNNDGWQDLYVANDFDVADNLYINQKNGTFKDEVLKATKHISNFSMGNDIADYDNDGNLDIMVVDMMAEDHKRIKTNMGGMAPEKFWEIVEEGGHYQYMFNTLQRNNGNGTFSDLAQLAGVTSTDWSWAPLLADFDNDGFKDLFVTNGVVSNNRYSDLTAQYEKKLDSIRKKAMQLGRDPQTMIDVMDFVHMAPTDKLPNYIYKNNGDLTFSKKMSEWGMDLPTLSNGAAYADFDNDGDLDLIINNINDNASLYKNNTQENKLGNYVRFNIDANKDVPIYGTKVTLYKNNTLWQVNHLSNARGYMSKSEDILHFGVGTEDKIEKVLVEWQDGSKIVLNDIAVNQVHSVSLSDASKKSIEQPATEGVIFKEVASSLKLDKALHLENEHDDYNWEILLPHKMSQFGPSIGVGDVNGDGREDFYMGGAAGIPGKLFIQSSSGRFDESQNGDWVLDRASEDMGVAFIDIDSDKDLDLFVVSGGNEFNEGDKALQDRLYINNGKGVFTKSTDALPEYLTSGSCVIPNDFDNDGDMDLFIGGRLVPKKYPHPANSHLLENRGGKFVDVSKEKAPELMNLGMVTGASWFDYDKDGKEDLVVVGEWMPVTVFTQSENGSFKIEKLRDLDNSEGWYYSVATEDMDGDGDEDIIVGNLGLNYKYKASVEEPFQVHSYDFDSNGVLDIVLSYYEHGEVFPVRGKSCSTQQIPSLGETFETFEQFGDSNLGNIYGESLKDALNLQSKTFASAYIENRGNGAFKVRPLPSLAQVSSVNSILAKDFDKDGHKDLLIAGNLYTSEIETPRNDAGTGLFLKGDSSGNFTPVSINRSGFLADNDAKDMKFIKVGSKEIILVANNNHYLQAIENL
jgi:PBP1b-binding outer membrane lipoprotein LpoB